jgi:uncharacterized cupin superfamily protein
MSWYVLNARDAQWWDRGPRGAAMQFVDDGAQVGVNLFVLGPGEPMSMYHWEADQEGFLVLSGEATLIVEDEARPLRTWDYFHKPAGVSHTIVGGPCVVLAIGAREHQDGEGWGGYTLSDLAARHDAASPEETDDPAVAYGRFPARQPSAYRGWLPE